MKASEAGHDAGYYDYRKDERASAPAAYSSNPWGLLGQPSTPAGPGGATYQGVSTSSPRDPMVAKQGGGSVYDWVLDQFKQYGMGDVGKAALDAIQGSHNEIEAVTAIRNSDAYKQRFAGNVARIQSGKGALSEGEYLAMESSYRQAMRAAGLPKGFYDQPDDLAKWIGGDVSVTEVATRAKTAMDLVNSKDPETLKAFKDFYGVDKGHLAAYYLDQGRRCHSSRRPRRRRRSGRRRSATGSPPRASSLSPSWTRASRRARRGRRTTTWRWTVPRWRSWRRSTPRRSR